MKKICAGIDFGTTNSTAAIADSGIPHLIKLEQNSDTIPTALFFAGSENDKQIYYGRNAINQYMNSDIDEGRLMRSLKRVLGTHLIKSSTKLNGRNINFEDVIKLFISHLKNKIDSAAGENVENVVMGRPVHFRDNDPISDERAQSELERIAKCVGFKNVLFQFEPIAAALAHERMITSEKLAIVADIGGGTSDFTVIKLSPERKNNSDRSQDILANTGVRIGGNDFDKDLSLKSFMPEFGMGTETIENMGSYNKILPLPTAPFFGLSTWSSVNELYTYKSLNEIKKYLFQARSPEKIKRFLEIIEHRSGHKNLEYVERAKMELSDKSEIKMILDFISDKPVISLNRPDFESAIENDMEKIIESIIECVKKSGVKKSDINLVILTGGSTEIPYITTMIKSHFPNAELSASDKLSSVGMGLAYDGIRRF